MTKQNNNKKDFLSITDLSAQGIWEVLYLAKKLKNQIKKLGKNKPFLKGKTLAMIFEKPSLRTHVSFQIAINQLGGHALYLGPDHIAMGTRESVSDVARVISSMADIIMARTFKHKIIKELADNSKVPVINGLSDLEHPCQILADLMTIWEVKDRLDNLTIGYVGDGENNIPHSLCLASAMLGVNFQCAAPIGYWMKKEVVNQAKKDSKLTGSKILETKAPNEAITNVDIVYTDTWISMGDEKEKDKRLKIFFPYQINKKLMNLANKEAIFMHDLPAYRGNEVTDDVIEGKQSVVFQQAENRLHVSKALICYLLSVKNI